MQDNTDLASESSSMILFYQTEDGKSRIEVKLEGGTVWLTQAMISELYQTSKQNVSLHINNILKDEELDNSTVKEYLTVQSEGKRDVQRKILFYNLDMVLAVGYRVQSHRGTQFRRWATDHLREFLIKGFVLDDERLREKAALLLELIISMNYWNVSGTLGHQKKGFTRRSSTFSNYQLITIPIQN